MKKILIVGHGFAGRRFFKVLTFLNQSNAFEIAIVDKDLSKLPENQTGLHLFSSLKAALSVFSPNIAIIAVNEEHHFDVLCELGMSNVELIMCEKPLAKDLSQARILSEKLKNKIFSMNMVERFSSIIDKFAEWKGQQSNYRTSRVEFFWGKNRIKDARPTIGVISEIIHPLDLVYFIFGYQSLEVLNVISTSSDFSINNDFIPDSLDLVAQTESYVVLGHSSFVWKNRNREIVGFGQSDSGTYRITFSFDNPLWDCDQLIIHRISANGKMELVLDYRVDNTHFPEELSQIYKVAKFVEESFGLLDGRKESSKLVTFKEAFRLQGLLESILNIVNNSEYNSNVNLFKD